MSATKQEMDLAAVAESESAEAAALEESVAEEQSDLVVEAERQGMQLPKKQITYPVSQAQVLKIGPTGRILTIHTPDESLIFPWPQQMCDDVAHDLSSRVDVAPAAALGSVKAQYEAAQRARHGRR